MNMLHATAVVFFDGGYFLLRRGCFKLKNFVFLRAFECGTMFINVLMIGLIFFDIHHACTVPLFCCKTFIYTFKQVYC